MGYGTGEVVVKLRKVPNRIFASYAPCLAEKDRDDAHFFSPNPKRQRFDTEPSRPVSSAAADLTTAHEGELTANLLPRPSPILLNCFLTPLVLTEHNVHRPGSTFDPVKHTPRTDASRGRSTNDQLGDTPRDRPTDDKRAVEDDGATDATTHERLVIEPAQVAKALRRNYVAWAFDAFYGSTRPEDVLTMHKYLVDAQAIVDSRVKDYKASASGDYPVRSSAVNDSIAMVDGRGAGAGGALDGSGAGAGSGALDGSGAGAGGALDGSGALDVDDDGVGDKLRIEIEATVREYLKAMPLSPFRNSTCDEVMLFTKTTDRAIGLLEKRRDVLVTVEDSLVDEELDEDTLSRFAKMWIFFDTYGDRLAEVVFAIAYVVCKENAAVDEMFWNNFLPTFSDVEDGNRRLDVFIRVHIVLYALGLDADAFWPFSDSDSSYVHAWLAQKAGNSREGPVPDFVRQFMANMMVDEEEIDGVTVDEDTLDTWINLCERRFCH